MTTALCINCGAPCPRGTCSSPYVQARRVLVRHLSHAPLLNRPFPDRLADLMTDLAPHLAPEPHR